ncbi:bacterio-opsin activator domain-containing protein [Natronobiforma cellulositropha]|uniref:bacterio-opsin activator domain-containing protein n=1 Tax=Natronobiforma cellulositropha TaxID=1679076 RepID=UPI0021D5CF70|nr:bacterio-opsin activator domain-containing protein [Natronobiforma cellulositropha]
MAVEPTRQATVSLIAGDGVIRDALEDAGYDVRRGNPDATADTGESADCVVVAGGPTETAAFLRTRDEASEVPIVYCPDAVDSEALSEALAVGVAAYVAPSARDAARVREAVDGAIGETRRRERDRERARAFEAIFDDEHTHTALLAADGTVVRANERLRRALTGAETERVAGRAFTDVAWWADDDVRTCVREAVERAREGDVAQCDLGVTVDGERRTLEATVRPVRDGDTVVSLVAEATDVTERVRLESELRRSEELHRVTLNNMTDTVLITDDDGAFTYVCPNVHFIFGYTDEEIHEMGTIDELLGSDLFERAALEEAGVLTNVECTATDRTGREHTLLVNVREVSIQEGTVLYSCRDVTKRKQREEALASLQRTARRLLYAETDREIGGIVVEDAPAILDVEASAAFVFDTDENVLTPVATSSAMERLHGPYRPVRASDDSLVGRCYVEGAARFFDDVRETEVTSNTTRLRSGAFVPLGDHGLFVAGSGTVGRFDEVTRELTDLLAATAEAALDRVERETRLRERDRALERQNERLTQLDRLNEIIREIDQVLVRAETREEIERAVCTRLTATDRFRFAWIGEPNAAGEALTARAWAGDDRGYLDSVAFTLVDAGEEGGEPAGRAAANDTVAVVSNVVDRLRESEWRKEALSRDYQSVISVPLAYDEFAYGVLSVYADRPAAFDDVSGEVFAELGETIASAMGAVERKSALLATSSTRLELEVGDPTFVFRRLATDAGCTVSFGGGVQRTADGTSVFATVSDASAEAVATVAADLAAVERVQVLTDDGERGGTLRLELARPFLASRLADHGIVLRRVEATPAGATVVIDVPSTVDPRRSVGLVENAVDDVHLVSKTTVDDARGDLESTLLSAVTDRQLEVIQVAYYGGFFESPRERTGEEIAATLGISPAAFYRHLRTVQRKVYASLFGDGATATRTGVE